MLGEVKLKQEDFAMMLVEKREDGVAIITLNRPDRHNAVAGSMHSELAALPKILQQDDDVRVAIITGAGRSFCSGADVAETSGGALTWDTMLVEARDLVMDFIALDKPVITAVKGYALGMGCTLALLGDVVIAGQSARFGDTHVPNQGVTAGDGGAALWPMLMGPQASKYYLLTGEHVPAEEAYRLGMVFKVVEDEALLDEAIALASRIAAGPPMAVRSTKASINRYMSLIVNEVLPFSLAAEFVCYKSEDHKESAAAFMEKRPAKYTGN
jgi:enoyl-CoA hydratase/carnithine racemase